MNRKYGGFQRAVLYTKIIQIIEQKKTLSRVTTCKTLVEYNY